MFCCPCSLPILHSPPQRPGASISSHTREKRSEGKGRPLLHTQRMHNKKNLSQNEQILRFTYKLFQKIYSSLTASLSPSPTCFTPLRLSPQLSFAGVHLILSCCNPASASRGYYSQGVHYPKNLKSREVLLALLSLLLNYNPPRPPPRPRPTSTTSRGLHFLPHQREEKRRKEGTPHTQRMHNKKNMSQNLQILRFTYKLFQKIYSELTASQSCVLHSRRETQLSSPRSVRPRVALLLPPTATPF
jgi:hypothetical protein